MITKSRTAKLAIGFVGAAVALSFAITPIMASAATIAELQAMIADLSAQLAALSGSAAATPSYTFSANLTVGSTGADVMNLQKMLNSSADTQLASSGVGSPGNETSYFGSLTRAAVMKFQTKNGISPVAGFVGPITRAKLNTMGGAAVTTTTPTTTTTLPTGGALSVSAGTQPTASLAPTSAARVPFTRFVLTAGSADVTVNSVTVERVGLSNDAAYSGVVLLKEDGTQIGIAKSLNSNHQALIGEPFVIKAGTSQTLTVAGNMGSSIGSYNGQVGGFNVVAVNTSASVAGSLPISGTQHTVNSNLTIGSVTMAISSYDPNSSQTKEIGVTNYKFSGIRVTAGSAEKINLKSIRWNQAGSAGANDLANIKVYVDGTAYDTTISADSKYYTAMFGTGISIDKGLAKDIYIQGDIVGAGSAARTIRFDLYKTTDLYMVGETYGYGITPPAGSGTAADATSEFTAGTPYFDGSKVTVSAGTVTAISKAPSVAAQNIAVNVPNQILGGFQTDIKGEPISIQSLAFTIATTGTWTSTTGITNITMVDQNGAVVAGPIDEATTCTTGCTITFTDTVTFPIGVKTYTIKGKLPTGAPGGATIIVSATPSSGWTTVTGQTTGNTISLSGNGAFSMNTMTVKAAALTITVKSTPAAQNIVAGGIVTFANYQLDASQSGEDVRFGTIPLYYNGASQTFGAEETKMTSCQLFDGTTPLNTGSNAANPSTSTATSTPLTVTVTLDQQYTVPKGAIKTLEWKCNVATSADANSQIQWGLLNGGSMTTTGVTSGSDVSESLTSNNGQVMTVATGSFAITFDSSSYALATAGATGVNIGTFKFLASNEDVNVTKIGLTLSTSTANDLGNVYLYQGTNLIGTAEFTGTNTIATSTLTSTLGCTTGATGLCLRKNTDVLVTIKADLAMIGTGLSGTDGRLVQIDVTNAEGSGALSGSTLTRSGVTAGVAGVRMFKSVPTVTQDTTSIGSGILDGKLIRFKISAPSNGSIGLYQLTFTLSTTTFAAGGGVSAIKLFVYNDSAYSSLFSSTVIGTSTGQFGDTMGQGCSVASKSCTQALTNSPTIVFRTATTTSTSQYQPLIIPANETKYFQLQGTVSGTQAGASVSTTLLGDAAYITSAHINTGTIGPTVPMTSSTTGALADTNNSFIWTANATTTAVNEQQVGGNDWANGYGVLSLPSTGFTQNRSI